jgi:ABC-type branched-subunit amino acid transport system substrate-binding protein
MNPSSSLDAAAVRLRRRSLLSCAGAAAMVGGFGGAIAANRPVVGISLPLTGVQAAVAEEMRQGYTAALSSVAELDILDDGAKPAAARKNMEAFAANPNVIATTGIVSTPSAQQAIPVAMQSQIPLVGIRSGAESLRDGNPYVFHLRASYEEEIDRVMQIAALYSTMAVLYHDDDFGRGSVAHAEKAAAARGFKVVLKLTVTRDSSDVKEKTATLARIAATTGIGATLLCLIEKPAMAAVRELRLTHKLILPVFGMSIIATSGLANSQDPAFEGLSLVSPYIPARTAVAEMARGFRAGMTAQRAESLIASPTAFEGYFYGSVVADAIQRGGASRKAIQAYLMQQRPFDVKQVALKFDDRRVGYRHIELMRKSGGALRS